MNKEKLILEIERLLNSPINFDNSFTESLELLSNLKSGYEIVSKRDYEDLDRYNALVNGGVDNWVGYGFAMQLWREENDQEN